MASEHIGRPSPRSLRELPPFPPVALKILGILADPGHETREVVRTIEADPVFASEVLHLANSPLFGLPRQIKTVKLAVVILGRDKLRAVTMSVAMRSYARAARNQALFQGWWRHSLACALLTDGLAAACSRAVDYAYTAGLVHCIGRLGLMSVSFPAFLRLAQRALREPEGVLASEGELFGVDHCEAGRIMMEEWGFPAALIASASSHRMEPAAGSVSLENLVRLGCRLASALGFCSLPGEAHTDLEELRDLLPRRIRGQLALDPAVLTDAVRCRIDPICAAGM